MQVGIKEQLAATLVQGQDSLPGPHLVIHGAPGDWSVAVTNTGTDSLWLASTRRPSTMRTFKTLDAAHAAAVQIAQLADPGDDARYVSVRVVMQNRE